MNHEWQYTKEVNRRYDLFTIARYLRARLVTGPYKGPRGNFSDKDHPKEWFWIDRLFNHYAR